MKKNIKIFFLFTVVISVFTVAVHAQQKPSERTFASEMKKVKEKQAARNAFISQTQQSTPVEENKTTTPAVQNANTNSTKTVNTKSTMTNQQPANNKPSEQSMKIPVKPAVIKQ